MSSNVEDDVPKVTNVEKKQPIVLKKISDAVDSFIKFVKSL